ncbi:Crp/Fnr family transcriptional regulator [Undibacterium sp. SXout20W]
MRLNSNGMLSNLQPEKSTFDAQLLALPASSWFFALSDSVRQVLLNDASGVSLKAGEMLFRRGDAPLGFYALLRGCIKMSTLSEDGREGILSTLEPGTWFGEISLIDGQPRTHDATALGNVELMLVTPEAFAHAMQVPQFAMAIAQILAYRIRLLYGAIEDVHLRSPRARTARRLLLLSGSNTMHASTPQSSIQISQESLAMMLGMSRQTLSKELKFLCQRKVISLGYRTIDIISPADLLHFCDHN